MAQTHIEAIEAKAIAAIAIDSVNVQQQIVIAGITSDAARQLICELRPVETLMPWVEAKVIEGLFLAKPENAKRLRLVDNDDD